VTPKVSLCFVCEKSPKFPPADKCGPEGVLNREISARKMCNSLTRQIGQDRIGFPSVATLVIILSGTFQKVLDFGVRESNWNLWHMVTKIPIPKAVM